MMRERKILKLLVTVSLMLGVMLIMGLAAHAADKVSCTGYWCASGNDYEESVMVNGIALGSNGSIEGLTPGEIAVLTVKAKENHSFDRAFLKVAEQNTDSFPLSGKDSVTFGNFTVPSSDFKIGLELSSQKYEVIYYIDGYHDSFFYNYNTEVKVKNINDFPDAPKRDGAVFIGWKDDSDAVFTPGSTFMTEKKNTKNGKYLNAQWITWKATHTVNASSLNVREGPGTDRKRIDGLYQDTRVMVLETQDGWAKIAYPGGLGWVSNEYLTPIGIIIEQTNPFEDVNESDEYYNAVMWAFYANPQLTNGMDSTHFGPHWTVTRGQAVTFLWRSQGCPEPSSMDCPFLDIHSDEYYYKAVLWAVEKGITKGVNENHFNPLDTLSTRHMITFLFRTKNPGKDGWDSEAATWAGSGYDGKPFGVNVIVNNTIPCPRCYVVYFLYKLK